MFSGNNFSFTSKTPNSNPNSNPNLNFNKPTFSKPPQSAFKPVNPPTLMDRFKASYKYVDALNNLPPTYETGEACKFPQLVPDPMSQQNIQTRLNEVEKSKRELDKINEQVKQSQKK